MDTPYHRHSSSLLRQALAAETGRPLRVVGWYHSHPHITVWPSHVDLQTQAQYQTMERTFVGLIFSCFSLVSEALFVDLLVCC